MIPNIKEVRYVMSEGQVCEVITIRDYSLSKGKKVISIGNIFNFAQHLVNGRCKIKNTPFIANEITSARRKSSVVEFDLKRKKLIPVLSLLYDNINEIYIGCMRIVTVTEILSSIPLLYVKLAMPTHKNRFEDKSDPRFDAIVIGNLFEPVSPTKRINSNVSRNSELFNVYILSLLAKVLINVTFKTYNECHLIRIKLSVHVTCTYKMIQRGDGK